MNEGESSGAKVTPEDNNTLQQDFSAQKSSENQASEFFVEEMAAKTPKKKKDNRDIILINNSEKKSRKLLFLAIVSVLILLAGAGIFMLFRNKDDEIVSLNDFDYANYTNLDLLNTVLYTNADVNNSNPRLFTSEYADYAFENGVKEFEVFINDFSKLNLKGYEAEQKEIKNKLQAELSNIKHIQSDVKTLKNALTGNEEAINIINQAQTDDKILYDLYQKYREHDDKIAEVKSAKEQLGCENLEDENPAPDDPYYTYGGYYHAACSGLSLLEDEADKDIDLHMASSTYIKLRLNNQNYPDSQDALDEALYLVSKARKNEK